MSKAIEVLRELEWKASKHGAPSGMGLNNGRSYSACPMCGGAQPSPSAYGEFEARGVGHKPDCRLAEVLREADAAQAVQARLMEMI